MNVIQGGPKPVVAVPADTVAIAHDALAAAAAVPVKAAAKGEQTSHYAREGKRDANVDDVRGRKVNVEA